MSDMDWNKHLLDKIEARDKTIAEQAREIEALKAQLAHQAKSWGREREIDEETIEALRAVLNACRSTCTRIIEQDGGILGGVDFHALRKGIDAAIAGKAVTP